MKITNLIDIRQTPEYAQYMQQNGWQIQITYKKGIIPIEAKDLLVNKSNAILYTKKIPLTPFSVTKALRYHPKHIKNINKPRGCLIYKDEPFKIQFQNNTNALNKNTQHPSQTIYYDKNPKNTWPVTPTKTIWINLKSPLELIKQELKQKTRYNLKQATTKINLKITTTPADTINQQQIDNFYQIWAHNKPYNWLFKPSKKSLISLIKSFQTKAFLIEASTHSNPKTSVASALILTSPNMSFYWHNASTDLGKQHYAPTLVVWEAIKQSKKRKLSVFDFEGVWDQRYPNLNQGWKGFTQFKQGFIKKNVKDRASGYSLIRKKSSV